MKEEYSVTFLESTNPMEDILTPVKQRTGYQRNATIPIYFYRLIGLEGCDTLTQDRFYTQIFRMHRALLNESSGRYIKFEGNIPKLTHDEIQWAIDGVAKGVPTKIHTLKDSIVSQIVNSKVLEEIVSTSQISLACQTFDFVMDFYMKLEKNTNESKVENFALKMIAWLRRYGTILFKNPNPLDIPKVLYYGDIKPHEVYFLTLLALLGCDVLYVHTEKGKDEYFNKLNQIYPLSKKMEFPESLPLEPFPETERLTATSTVAYNASKELQEIIYTADVGIFKPRQFENGNTKSITLHTTYDELKLFWSEEARLRPDFQVQHHTVYIPTIFAKINGTHEDLLDYWKDVNGLAKEEHVVLYKNLPFSNVTYSRQDMYASAYFFTPDGFLIREELKKSPIYRLNYLKPSAQDFVLNKIHELIHSKIFLHPVDEKRRLKILMTVLNMDAELMHLIEAFDYTGKIPKIVVYSGGRNQLSEEDAILLAFFHLVGADIVIWTPTNYANIENWIKPEYFTTHQLPSVRFDMNFEEQKKNDNDSSFLPSSIQYVAELWDKYQPSKNQLIILILIPIVVITLLSLLF